MSGILLVAATEMELCGRFGLVCGVGPVEAAAAVAAALERSAPSACVHVGIAGGRDLPPGTLVVGAASVYGDLDAAVPVVRHALPDPGLHAAVRRALPDAVSLPIGTTAAIGTAGPELRVEGMEGFGVLRACELAGVPAVELRSISNEIGEPDRSCWDVAGAVGALSGALESLLPALRG
jgi:futalosine hydrolase